MTFEMSKAVPSVIRLLNLFLGPKIVRTGAFEAQIDF